MPPVSLRAAERLAPRLARRAGARYCKGRAQGRWFTISSAAARLFPKATLGLTFADVRAAVAARGGFCAMGGSVVPGRLQAAV